MNTNTVASRGSECCDMQVRPPVLRSFDLQGVVDYIQEKQVRNIICMCGAGISVSAGIPDFRTPGTGLYDNLQKYDLPHPTAVFELGFFRTNPQPFFTLAKELAPGNFKPTPTHHFLKLLHDKGVLRRCYTQNIDSLEAKAGLPANKVVAAHGNFDTAHCIDCNAPYPLPRMQDAIKNAEVCYCEACGGLAKPSIVFFGENLPARFFALQEEDFAECDLLIVMGTSLVVHPFAGLLNLVGLDCPRLLINREVAGEMHDDLWKTGCTRGMWFGDGTWRDVKHLGDCDDAVVHLAELLDWREDLESLRLGQGTPS